MTKVTYPITIHYTYDPSHRGAPYTLNDGESWLNHGDFCEILAKSVFGFALAKDANGRYDLGDDIPELGASVKSSKATLTGVKLGYDFNSIKAHYMATVHSTSWLWVSCTTEEVTVYTMNKDEFSTLLDRYAYFDPDRKVIRFRPETQKQIRWMDENCQEA